MPLRERGSSSRKALLAAVATGLLAFGAPAVARADTPTQVMRADLQHYFGGEKNASLTFLYTGVASLAVGSALIARPNQIARGAGYPMAAIGLIQTIGATVFYSGVDAKVAKLEKRLGEDPAAYRAEERARIEKVNGRFVILKITEIAIIGAGVALSTAGFLTKNDTLKGVGIGIATEAALILVLDIFAERRAHVYSKALDRFQPPVGFVIEPGPNAAFHTTFTRPF